MRYVSKRAPAPGGTQQICSTYAWKIDKGVQFGNPRGRSLVNLHRQNELEIVLVELSSARPNILY